MAIVDGESVNPEEKKEKSRHLPILEFFEILQVEFIMADLRYKIYPRVKDKTYWAKVKDGKRATIEKLAERNQLPSIFTDEYMLRLLEKKVYRDTGYPLFTYRNAQHKMEQEFYDFANYYFAGSDVRVEIFDESKIGKIVSYMPFYTDAIVEIDGNSEKHNINKITRIL